MINSNDIVWEVIAEADDIPVRGNAMCSDDPSFDKECEDEILARLEQGDVWAWAYVKVRGTYKGILSAEATLGACNYANEAEFLADEAGYFGSMKMEVIDALNRQIATLLGSER